MQGREGIFGDKTLWGVLPKGAYLQGREKEHSGRKEVIHGGRVGKFSGEIVEVISQVQNAYLEVKMRQSVVDTRGGTRIILRVNSVAIYSRENDHFGIN